MEQKLNIAKILKNKPRGTKLYSMIHGKCSFEAVTDEIFKINFCTSKFGLTQSGECTLIKFGNMYDEGECVVFPSKEMRNWSKFAWKKGDVLVNKDGNAHVIFEGFDDDTYETFNGNNYLWKNEGITMCFGEYEDELPTSDFSKANQEDAQKYIHQIEKRLGYKLNFETLKIEKQPEFKDGDIVTMHKKNCDIVFIFNRLRTEGSFYYYAFHTLQTNNTGVIDCHITLPYAWTFFGSKMNFATDSEKQQLFDALAKEGKAWDAEKKQIVDLKPKVELKPFDKVVVRCSKADKWSIDFFSYKVSNGYICTGDAWFGYCLPYNEETAHLLGTTDDWEGGKQ